MVARVTLEIALRKEFDYAVPPDLAGQIQVGSRVKVPFGPRQVLGVVTAVLKESESAQPNLRSVLKIVGRQSLVTPKVLRLARWIAAYYCCAPEVALRSVLPDSVRAESAGWREQLVVRALTPSGSLPKLTKRQTEVWNVVEEWRQLPLQRLVQLCHCTSETVRRLEEKGLVMIAPEVSERDPYAHEQILPTKHLDLNLDQARALDAIVTAIDQAGEWPQTVHKGTGFATGKPSPLTTKKTTPPSAAGNVPDATSSEEHPGGGDTEADATTPGARVFLLHGVTGSGKTEVYLQAIAHTLSQGKGAIVLVPEISLTPQTVERFKARFSSGPLQTLVAVLHSHLSAGERHDEWHKIRQGRARIAIGARSAIFAPVDPLGLIIVDEEHEHSYKQEEAPRYNARDVAVVRGAMEKAVVVLGSATPSLESYYNAQRGKYTLLEMPTRADNKKLPIVRVVDMRQAARLEKGPPVFSRQLQEAIRQRLERGEQAILFLNRRGYSTSLQCPHCGFVAECPNCSVALTYHRHQQLLLCHICGHSASAPAVCPADGCANPAIRFAGLGTQKVEDVLSRLFPQARIKRMDSDALQRKEDYRRILGDFRAGKLDILVGTQMIAKGLHFPRVTLVGIVNADLGLHLPDFRAGERTFQLLTQVSGRAGRGEVEGEVYVQTFTPFHPAIQYARRHDFRGFCEQEMEFRQQLRYPPFSRLALLTLKGRNEDKVSFSAGFVRNQIEAQIHHKTDEAPEGKKRQELLKDLIISGPAPAPLARAETYYRFQIILRTKQMMILANLLSQITANLPLPEDIRLTVDIDPVGLM